MGVGIHWRINWRERYGSVNTSHFPTILENTFLWGNQAPAFVQKTSLVTGNTVSAQIARSCSLSERKVAAIAEKKSHVVG